MRINFKKNSPNTVVLGDNLQVLKQLPDESFKLIYIDPPFNTGVKQTRQIMKTVKNDKGDRTGYKGQIYETTKLKAYCYNDNFDNYMEFLGPRIEQAWRLLREDGTFYLHLDYREVHYVKVFLDNLFGRQHFLNEIIWAYDYGAKAKNKWPAKHDNILVYVKNPKKYYFNNEQVDREPYMAPGLVTKEKRDKGKLPTDTWWHTIVSPNGKEKTGYPTQKPLGILRRIIQASSQENDWVLDFFAGSGTTAVAANQLSRKFFTIDQNPQSIEVIKERFKKLNIENVKFIDNSIQ